MEHVVHINDGDDRATPLVLSLLAGEEISINLKVINHGEPSNLSLRASGSISRAVRLNRSSYHVALEEVIPILARMPEGPERLDGDILFLGSGREIRLPVTLLCDSEENEGHSRNLRKPGLGSHENVEGDEWEDEEPSEVGQEEEDKGQSYSRSRRLQEDEVEREPRKISFSRDRDLQIYRSAVGRRRSEDGIEGAGEMAESPGKEGYEGGEEQQSDRIDDRFLDRRRRRDEPVRPHSERGLQEASQDEGGFGSAPGGEEGEEDALAFRREADSESREIIHQAEREELNPLEQEEAFGRVEYARDQGGDDQQMCPSRLEVLGRSVGIGDFTMQKVVPGAIFLTLVVVLVLTFIAESLPEFPGALASSILIVTLIIYGAATLLKA